jgi:hypothetical protein
VTIRSAVPFIILAAIFLPLPFAIGFLTFSVLLAVRPRGELDRVAAVISRFAGPALLRSPPR